MNGVIGMSKHGINVTLASKHVQFYPIAPCIIMVTRPADRGRGSRCCQDVQHGRHVRELDRTSCARWVSTMAQGPEPSGSLHFASHARVSKFTMHLATMQTHRGVH